MSAATELETLPDPPERQKDTLPHLISASSDLTTAEQGQSLRHYWSPALGERSWRERTASLALQFSHASLSTETAHALAARVAHCFRQFFVVEYGTPRLDDALREMKRRLCMEREVERSLERLIEDATSTLNSAQPLGKFSDLAGARRDLDGFLAWWIRRQHSLAALRDSAWTIGRSTNDSFDFEELDNSNSPRLLVDDDQDALFNLRVTHDVQWAGLSGFRVSAGVFLRGRVSQSMWVRLHVRHEGDRVFARPGFEQWVDEFVSAESESWDEGSENVESSTAGAPPFSVFVPLRSPAQRKFFDMVELFVPYRALDLPYGNREIELCLGLFDEHGFLVAQQAVLEQAGIPKSHRGPSRSSKSDRLPREGAPAPQFLGYAETDLETGASIKLKRAVCRASLGRSDGAVALVSFDIGSGSLEAEPALGRAGVCAAARLEFRVIDEQGSPLPARSFANTRVRDNRGTFVWRDELSLARPLSTWKDLELRVPLTELDISEVNSQSTTYAEVVMVASDGKVLCGTIHPLALPLNLNSSEASPRTSESAEVEKIPSSISVDEQLSAIVLHHFEAKSGVSNLTPNGDRHIRVAIELRHPQRTHAALSVTAGLCAEDGLLLRETTLCAVLGEAGSSGLLVFRFPEGQLLDVLPRTRVFPLKLSAALEIRSLEGEVLLRKSSEFSLSETSSFRERPAQALPLNTGGVERDQQEVRLVEVKWHPPGIRGEECLEFHVDVPTIFHAQPSQPVLYVEFFDASGEPVSQPHLQTPSAGADLSVRMKNDWLPGTVVPLQMPEILAGQATQVPFWTQIQGSVEINRELVDGHSADRNPTFPGAKGLGIAGFSMGAVDDTVRLGAQSLRGSASEPATELERRQGKTPSAQIVAAKLMLFSSQGTLQSSVVVSRPSITSGPGQNGGNQSTPTRDSKNGVEVAASPDGVGQVRSGRSFFSKLANILSLGLWRN